MLSAKQESCEYHFLKSFDMTRLGEWIPGLRTPKRTLWLLRHRAGRQLCRRNVQRQHSTALNNFNKSKNTSCSVHNRTLAVGIVKLLTEHVVRGDFLVSTNGSPPWWWGYQSVICIHDWWEMGHQFSTSLIQLGLRDVSGKSFHAVPPSQGTKVTTTATVVVPCKMLKVYTWIGNKENKIRKIVDHENSYLLYSPTPSTGRSYSWFTIIIISHVFVFFLSPMYISIWILV